MPQCGRVCPSVGGCSSIWEGAPQCGRVHPRVGRCAPEWEGAPQCGRVFPSIGGCVPVWEGVSQCQRVSQCERVCPSVGRCVPVCVFEVWVSLSHVFMMDTQVHLCVHLITRCFGHVAKAYVATASGNQLLLIPLCKCSSSCQLSQLNNRLLYNITYSVGCSAYDMTMLTSTSCTTGGVLCTTLAHIHKSMESHYICVHITYQ